jgi:integration host factor subunit alpha
MSDRKSKTITKEMITNVLVDRLGLSYTLCQEITNNIFQEIVDMAKLETKVTLKNFGKFYINHKESRPGLDIHSRSAVTIPPRSVFRFTPSQSLKNEINGNKE